MHRNGIAMSTHALLVITTTATTAATLLLPVADNRPRSPTTPPAASTRPHVSGPQQPTAPAVPCALSWRLDPSGRPWLMTARRRDYDPGAAQHLLERVRQLEHDPLR